MNMGVTSKGGPGEGASSRKQQESVAHVMGAGCWVRREPRTDSTKTRAESTPARAGTRGQSHARLGLPAVEDSHQGSLATWLSFPLLMALHTLTHK